MTETTQQVVRLLMEQRHALFAYIYAATRDYDVAEEVLQEVSMAVCEDAASFRPGTNFGAWSREIARRRIAAYYRIRGRDPLSLAPSDLERLGDAFAVSSQRSTMAERAAALRECLSGLKPFLRRLFGLRYGGRLDLAAIAREVGREPESVRKALYRGRAVLRECVERRLRAAGDLE